MYLNISKHNIVIFAAWLCSLLVAVMLITYLMFYNHDRKEANDSCHEDMSIDYKPELDRNDLSITSYGPISNNYSFSFHNQNIK